MSVDEKAHSTNNGESADNTPILVTPSALLGSVDDARALLNTASDLLSHNLARPVPLTQAITPSAEQEADLQRQSDQAGSSETSSRFWRALRRPDGCTTRKSCASHNRETILTI